MSTPSIQLPGYGLHFDHKDEEAELRSAVKAWKHTVITNREKCMLLFINQITEKPDWQRKVHDESIVAKWKQEAKELNWGAAGVPQGDMTDTMFSYCVDELRAKAALYESTGILAVLDASACVLKSDKAIPAELKEALRRDVAALEDVPENQKDWHPGSDGKVLDLVHPSLFPLVYERSRILPTSKIGLDDCLRAIGEGEVIPAPTNAGIDSINNFLYSRKFQWLPCDVSFPDGEHARIDSYINNLHPVDHKSLYSTIEKLITRAIPFWNIVYQWHISGPIQNDLRVTCTSVNYELPPGTQERPGPDFVGDEMVFWRALEQLRIYHLPEPTGFKSLPIEQKHVEDKFAFLGSAEKKIQVIVKLANIHLTPEKPEYDGGSWHIEGQLNEHIVSTALYYYDNDNITDSSLSFRTKVDAEDFSDELYYEQGDFDGIEKIFAIDAQGQNFQDLGAIPTPEDRFIAFPNGFQHRVGKFKLADPSKPGHRKIVALFLVAPTLPIISTANIPPQQRDWWVRQVKNGSSKLSELPAELVDMIGDGVEDFPIGMDEAKRIREELMSERGRVADRVDEAIMDYEFNFCEH